MASHKCPYCGSVDVGPVHNSREHWKCYHCDEEGYYEDFESKNIDQRAKRKIKPKFDDEMDDYSEEERITISDDRETDCDYWAREDNHDYFG